MRRFVEAHRPTAIIHCAAYTAVDKAEDEPELCREVNAAATGELARIAKEIGAKFLYISTDYVFPGTGEDFYEPEDEKAPCNVYGESKLLGEEAAREALEELFIVRISWVFGENGKNFIKTMLRLAETHEELSVVGDQIGSPTYTRDLARLLEDIILGIVAAPIPFIAAINGQAAGAGMSLALACDLRVAEPRTKLNIAYGMIGASTDGGMSWFLPRYAGFSAATELLYTQPVLRAARAQELSLVHRVSEPGELNACAEQLAEQIAGSASHTVRAAKSMLAARYVVELEEHMHAEHEFFARGVLTEDFRNAVHAMQRGEIPSFD